MNPYLSLQEAKVKGSLRKRKATSTKRECFKLKREYELAVGDFQVDTQSVLGRGNFGVVYKGIVRGKEGAIKNPTGSFKTILTEAKIHSHLEKHINIVGFLGIYRKEIANGILYIATDFYCNGSLENFLREKKVELETTIGLSTKNEALSHQLARFCLEIARAMNHIQTNGVVHRDLATRNVFLDSNFVCKVGDFGLSYKIGENCNAMKRSNESLPWRWMAYESFTETEFSTKSDMWSYGVTLWEIYTLGNQPYSECCWTRTFVTELKNGLRLPAPSQAVEQTYNKMLECWYINRDQRPSFSEMAIFFSSLQMQQMECLLTA